MGCSSIPSILPFTVSSSEETRYNLFTNPNIAHSIHFLVDCVDICKPVAMEDSLIQTNLFNNGFTRKSLGSSSNFEPDLKVNASNLIVACKSNVENSVKRFRCSPPENDGAVEKFSNDRIDSEIAGMSTSNRNHRTACDSKPDLNILSRPKRSVHSYRFTIPENWHGLPNSDESDEDFVCENAEADEISPLLSDNETDSHESSHKTAETSEKNSVAQTGVGASGSVVISQSPKSKEKSSGNRRKRKAKASKAEILEFEDAETKAVLEILRSKFPSTKRPKNSESPYLLYRDNTNSYTVVNTSLDDSSIIGSSCLSSLNKERLGNINSSDHPVCCFCHKKSEFLGMGPLFGPYKTSPIEETSFSKNIWVHDMCCVWAPGTYVRVNQLFGLNEALTESLDKVCKVCKLKSACLKCSNPRCNSFFHYPCALRSKCRFNYESFTLECNKRGHRRK